MHIMILAIPALSVTNITIERGNAERRIVDQYAFLAPVSFAAVKYRYVNVSEARPSVSTYTNMLDRDT